MNSLTIYYDGHCGLCGIFKNWMLRQEAAVRLEFIDLHSDGVGERKDRLMQMKANEDIVVVDDQGRAWQGDSAWIVCLWVLWDFRDWSFRLASPALRPLSRRVVQSISTNRNALSNLFKKSSEREVETLLRQIPERPSCHRDPQPSPQAQAQSHRP